MVLQSSQCSAARRPSDIPVILRFPMDDKVFLYYPILLMIIAPRRALKRGAVRPPWVSDELVA
jgi:hypothetical protein